MDALNLSLVLLVVVAILVVAVVALLLERTRRVRKQRALEASEERFRLLADRTPVMIWTARPDTTLDYLNNTCVEFSGITMEKLLDEGWLNVVHPEDRDYCIGIYGPAFQARAPFTMEYRLRRADGAYRWMITTGVPKFGPDGGFTGYIGSAVDISERKNAESEIQQLAGRLITAHEDERRRLARELHDDLTQRLARFAIDAGRMENGANAPEGAGPLRQGLVRLSEDVHALSYRLHPSVLDDLGLVEALKAECNRVSRLGDLRVEVEAREVPQSVPAEASLCLFRVAQEALSNAARHGHATAVTVMLSPRSAGLQLAVSDNGSGFDATRPRDHPSLGLASMRERVRLVSGELDIDSAPGRGTKVVAWVPA